MQEKDKLILLQNLVNRATEIAIYNATHGKREVDILELNDTLKKVIKLFKARLGDLQ